MSQSIRTLNELREFANFTAREQRYIRSSLDVALGRDKIFEHWVRDTVEEAHIKAQKKLYEAKIDWLRQHLPSAPHLDIADFMGNLIRMSAYDLSRNYLECFRSYRFLYERILTAKVRPWLPSAFSGAAALPAISPDRRKTLLISIREAEVIAPGWSDREPEFYPEWVEKEAC